MFAAGSTAVSKWPIPAAMVKALRAPSRPLIVLGILGMRGLLVLPLAVS